MHTAEAENERCETSVGETILTWRKLVIVSANDILADISRVSNESHHPPILTSLDFIVSALHQFQEIFIPPIFSVNCVSHDNPGFAYKDQLLTQPSYVLTRWIICHLLRLLSVPGVAVIHDKTRSVLNSILVSTAGQNQFVFRIIALQLIACLAELSKVSEQFFSVSNADFKAKIRYFETDVELIEVDDTEHVLANRPIVLSDPESCQQLQIGITSVLHDVAFQLSLAVYDQVHSADNSGDCKLIWAVIACQLEYGEVELKMVSLRMAQALLDSGLPVSEILDYFINCLVALVDLLCSGFSECAGDYIALENALSDVLKKLSHELITWNLELSQVARCCLVDTLSLNGIVQSVATHGTLQLRTQRLPCELCDYVTTAIRIYGLEQDSYSSLCYRLLEEVAANRSTLYHYPLEKSVIFLLLEVIVIEVTGAATLNLKQNNCFASETALTSSTEIAVNEERVSSFDRIMNSESSCSSSALFERSPFVSFLSNRLEILLSEVDKDFASAEVHLHEIQVILEVVAYSCLLCDQAGNNFSLSSIISTHLGRLFVFWSEYLINICGLGSDKIERGYSAIVRTMGSIVFIHDLLKLSAEQMSLMCEVLSLPWLASEVNWMDLKPVYATKLGKSMQVLADQLDSEGIAYSVRILNMLPRQMAPRWRKHVLCKAAGDHRDEVRKAAVCSLPYLLHYLGPSANHLIADVLHGMVQGSSGIDMESIASVIGSLACVVTSASTLQRTISFDRESDNRGYCVKLQCSSCQQKSQQNCDRNLQLSGSSVTSSKKLGNSAAMLVPLVKALCSSDQKNVKLRLIGEFERLFGHVWYWSASSVCKELVAAALSLLQDLDYSVRRAFCGVIKHLVAPEGVAVAEKTNRLIITKLTAFEMLTSTNKVANAETIVMSAGELVRVAEGDLLLNSVIVLLNVLLFSSSPLLEAIAMQQMKQISVYRKISLRQLFMQFGRALSKAVASCIHDTKLARSQWDPTPVLQKVADVFSFDDIQTFLKNTEHLLLPHLVKKATPAASSLLKIISRIMDDPNHKNVIVRTIGDIFCHLVCSCDAAEDMKKVITYIENEMDLPLTKLLRLGNHIDSLLLIHLSESYEQVLNGLRILLKAKGSLEGPDIPLCNSEQLASLLQPNLLGILVYFDKHLNDGTVPLIEKRQAYQSLIQLMKLMGSHHVTCVRMHVMTTLKIGLQFQDRRFAELCCEAWDCFVHILEVSVLGSMLSQIVVSLIALLHKLPNRVAQIFHFLIIDNRENLLQQLHELYFLPNIPELSGVNAVLRPYVDAMYSGKDLVTQIGHLIKGASHESVDVRQVALSKLAECLRLNKDTLHRLIINHETVDPIISQLVTVLLSGCRETDLTTRLRFGQCLGEIGAIDPGRLELLTSQPKEDATKFVSSMCDDFFAFELINELAKAFLRADDRTAQDCVAFAMQELLRIYDIRPELEENAKGSKLWKRFSLDVQEILMPLTQSRYMLNFVSNSSTLTHPIYRSRKGSTFDSWVCCLTSYLGSKLIQERSKRVFEACRGVIKLGGDSNIALFILPHVTLQVLIDNTGNEHTVLGQEIMAVLNDIKTSDKGGGPPTDLGHMASQTVFSVLDHLTKWTRHRMTQIAVQSVPSASSNKTSTSSASDGATLAAVENDRSYREVKSFLDLVSLDVLAEASFNCGAYTRAFMHHEQFVRRSSSSQTCPTSSSLDFLLKLYVALDEPDGVAGALAIQQTPPSLAQQILAFESIGRLSDASACCEHAIQSQPGELIFRHGKLRNILALGELNSALDIANSVITDSPHWMKDLNCYRVEAAWKLGQWDKLQHYVKLDNSVGWDAGLGNLLIAAKLKDEASFQSCLQHLRLEQMVPLSAASMEAGSYQRGYECIARLHMLNEIEDGFKVLTRFPSHSTESSMNINFNSLMSHWNKRLQCCQSSYRYQAEILNLRRIILRLAKEDSSLNVDQEIGQCWLQSARVARKCGLLQTAQSLLLSAADYKLSEFSLEKAKWLWAQGDLDHAQSFLEKAIEEAYPDRSKFKAITSSTCDEKVLAERLNCANMLLQLGRYSDETASWESNAIVRQLREVTQVHGEWEDGYFYVASYYDKVMMATTGPDRREKRGDFIMQVVQNFGQSLLYGSQYIYQSMPRMLSLWLDYGAEVVSADIGDKSDTLRQGMKASLTQLNRVIASYGERLAPYQLLTVLPQLISRICHAHPDVFSQLKVIIASLLKEFPQQSMWMMMAVSKSSYPMRVKRCQEIFAHARLSRPDLSRFISDMTRLVDKLLDLCNRQDGPAAATSTLSITQHFKPLQRLLDDKDFSPILLPLQSQMTPILPAIPVPPASHIPFASSAVYLQGLEDTVEVLASLQRPKKVTFRGSDGRRYPMLCKPKDDLRKDARLMEFNGIVNRCLKHDAESRRRSLHIRTFTVTALNEECGLLEWVLNTCGLRPILLKLYKERGLYMSGKELKALQLPPNAVLEKKLNIFKTKLMPRHPPIFSEWFLKTFPDPTSWYNARLAYCRTTAVMSMVGYVLGLGDRHGENILVDSTTGDCVHVDFNCLFNKGETFDYPEIVPFRLTHNMVEAMGLLGYEGIFRRSCEITLRVMRDQTDPLMSVLKTFIFDPLVEWSKPPKGRVHSTESGEIRNEKAQTHVNNIEDRLRGIFKNKTKSRGLPLSVEGHVRHLIKEATDENNLCQMYIGWAAYM